ncbi:NB-ARC domain-containing protein [Streptomyces sp. NPDC046203]|uniref:NB-ARC domain-containing protein n=1 Tax=Streptomyces sp. NPDC046203 TaxID=3154602 RepID=UPI0033E53CFA
MTGRNEPGGASGADEPGGAGEPVGGPGGASGADEPGGAGEPVGGPGGTSGADAPGRTERPLAPETRNSVSGGHIEGPVAQVGVVQGSITFNYHAAAGGTEPAADRRPDQVPRPPRGFVDRHEPLAVLDEVFAYAPGEDAPGHCPIGVFSGLPGIGKTAAASQWAHRNQRLFPGGQLFVDFAALRADSGRESGRSGGGGAVGAVGAVGGAGGDVSEALAGCLRALGVQDAYLPASFVERAALYRELSGKRGRLLVVLDDVTSPAQVTALVPQGDGSALLATSTWQLGELVLDGASLLPLDVLDADSALELLTALCGPRRIADDPAAAARLVDLCGGLPLAVRLCAARLLTRRNLTLARLADELSDEQSRLDRIAVSGAPARTPTSAREERTVSAALDLVYRDLPDSAARLYRALGRLPQLSFDTAVAAAAAGSWPLPETAEALGALEDASLLSALEDQRYTLHGLVRLHARRMSDAEDPPGAVREAVGRVAGHYLRLVVRADLAVRADRLRITDPAEVLGGASAPAPARDGDGAAAAGGPTRERTPDSGSLAAADPFAGSDDPGRDALAWLEAERGNILAVLRTAAGLGFDRVVWQTAESFTVLFLHHRHLAEWRESLELGIAAAERDRAAGGGGAGAAEARLRSLLSRPLLDLGQDERAREHLAVAERLAVESGHVVLQASVQEFAGRYWDRHDPARAIDAYRASLALNAEAREARGEALARYFLGCAQHAAGDPRTALATLGRARDELLALPDKPDRRMAARALADTGRARAALGDLAGATADLTEAAEVLRQEQAFHYEARIMEDLAGLAERSGDPERARQCLRRALAVYEEGGSPRAATVLERLTRG